MATQENEGLPSNMATGYIFQQKSFTLISSVCVREMFFLYTYLWDLSLYIIVPSGAGLLLGVPGHAVVPWGWEAKTPLVSGQRHTLVLHHESKEKSGEGTGHVLLQLNGKRAASNAHTPQLSTLPFETKYLRLWGNMLVMGFCILVWLSLGATESGQILWVGASVATIVAPICANCKKVGRGDRWNFKRCFPQKDEF